jgi:hypothetical protein
MIAEVMQATGNLHDQIRKALLEIAKNIFHDSATLDTGQDVFNHNPVFGDQAIGSLVSEAQELAAPLFLGLDGEDLRRLISLKAAAFSEPCPLRVLNGFQVGSLLIVFHSR